MRDQHWGQCHQEGVKTNWFQQNPDEDEIQPLLFDLVRADRVELVKSLLPRLAKMSADIKNAIFILAAGSGSTAMVDLVRSYASCESQNALVAAVKGDNIETFRHLLHIYPQKYPSMLPEILKSKNKEFLLDWEAFVDADYESWSRVREGARRKSAVPFGDRYIRPFVLTAAKEVPEAETFILLLWEKLNLAKNLTKVYLGDALLSVAMTCCSVTLAKYLIDAGAQVDHRRSSQFLTPLHYAVKHNTAQAAELVKFLLSLDADPTAFSISIPGKGSKIRRIRDEAGAKGISKWLGVSWDELVANTETEKTEDKGAELAS
jgi:hypothetical protein